MHISQHVGFSLMITILKIQGKCFISIGLLKTIRMEEISGIPTIDFSYPEENNDKLIGMY